MQYSGHSSNITSTVSVTNCKRLGLDGLKKKSDLSTQDRNKSLEKLLIKACQVGDKR